MLVYKAYNLSHGLFDLILNLLFDLICKEFDLILYVPSNSSFSHFGTDLPVLNQY